MNAAKLLETDNGTPKEKLPSDFYDKLEQNKQKFLSVTDEEKQGFEPQRRGRDSSFNYYKF